MKVIVSFPPGGGGSWLMYLIRALTREGKWIDKTINFHHAPRTKYAFAHHRNFDDNQSLKFVGTFSFNMLLNQNKKTDQFKSIEDEVERMKSYTNSAAYILQCSSYTPDLNFDLLFTDRETFINNLFDRLETCEIPFEKDISLCNRAIDNYIRTCCTTKPYFENWDNELWIGWCNGILKFLKEPFFDLTASELRSLLESRKDFFKQFTLERMYDIT